MARECVKVGSADVIECSSGNLNSGHWNVGEARTGLSTEEAKIASNCDRGSRGRLRPLSRIARVG